VPDGFGLFQLTLHFSMVMIGGAGSILGSIFGAVTLTALPELLRGFQAYQEIIYGGMLVLVVLFMPAGIAGSLQRFGLLPREVLVRGWREFSEGEVNRKKSIAISSGLSHSSRSISRNPEVKRPVTVSGETSDE
jgi:hypothetical protein